LEPGPISRRVDSIRDADEPDIVELGDLPQPVGVTQIARQPVQRLGDHHIDRPAIDELEELVEASAGVGDTGYRVVREEHVLADRALPPLHVVLAELDLILDRAVPLVLRREPSVHRDPP